MAQGYPARKRTRKAYWRGVKSAKFARAVNPYKNEVLRDLFERGRTRTVPNDPISGGTRPPGPGSTPPPPKSTRAPRPKDRPGPFRGF